MEDEPFAGNPRRLRERELAERRDVGADALLREQPQQRDVRERLRAVDDERARRRVAVRANLRADRLLAVDDERRAELLRERARASSAERQLAGIDPRTLGEELQHRESVASTSHAAAGTSGITNRAYAASGTWTAKPSATRTAIGRISGPSRSRLLIPTTSATAKQHEQERVRHGVDRRAVLLAREAERSARLAEAVRRVEQEPADVASDVREVVRWLVADVLEGGVLQLLVLLHRLEACELA